MGMDERRCVVQVVRSLKQGRVAPWRRALGDADWEDQRRPQRWSDLFALWIERERSTQRQTSLFQDDGVATIDEDDPPYVRPSFRSTAAARFFPPGFLRQHIQRSLNVSVSDGFAPSPGPLHLPPAWALRGDEDNATVVQRLADALHVHWDREEDAFGEPLGRLVLGGGSWTRADLNPLVEELATAFSLIVLRIPWRPQASSEAVKRLMAEPDPEEVLALACARAWIVAEVLCDVILDGLPAEPPLLPAPDTTEQIALRFTRYAPVVATICRGPKYQPKHTRRVVGGLFGDPAFRSPSNEDAATVCGDLVSLLRLSHDGTYEDAWRKVGSGLRETLERGERLPYEVFERLRECAVPGTFPVSHWWQWMRREHLRVVWVHRYASMPVADLFSIPRLRWAPWRLAGHLRAAAIRRDGSTSFEAARRTAEAKLTNPSARVTLPPAPWSLPIHNTRPKYTHTPPGQPESIRTGTGGWGLGPMWNWPANALTLHDVLDSLACEGGDALPEASFLETLDQVFVAAVGAASSPSISTEDWDGKLVSRLDPSVRYRRLPIPRTDGRLRWIDVPHPAIAAAQRMIANMLVRSDPGRPEATGFTPNRSALLHARFHAGCRSAVVVDLRDFFWSVRRDQAAKVIRNGARGAERRLRGAWPFRRWSENGVQKLIEIVFHTGRRDGVWILPQGGPSSPAIANLVAHELDEIVLETLRAAGMETEWIYSRYADDLVISTRKSDPVGLARAKEILESAVRTMGWRTASEKTRVWTADGGPPLVLCGTCVPADLDGELGLPRETARRVRAAWHHASRGSGTPADFGLLAHAYAVTGRHAYRVVAPGHTQRVVSLIATALAGEAHCDDFVAGWLGLKPT